MAIIQLLLLTAFVMTNFPESKSLSQAKKKTSCGIRRLNAFDMLLTCYFHVNISALQIDFAVYLDKGEQSPRVVADCMWTPKLECLVDNGYKYEDDIVVYHDHINIRILNANTEHVGTYTCQMMGESDSGNCNLIEEKLTQTLPSVIPYTGQTSRTNNASTPATTSLVSDDRQTQSADEQSSATSEVGSAKGMFITFYDVYYIYEHDVLNSINYSCNLRTCDLTEEPISFNQLSVRQGK
ncbi:uncharacterized protein LOC112569587 [Pomacea canaliculata]|uniref:uncharacterized protein LOC112569587 n=1 Tax=Pomacea canaliculata TaxID=400727 RepID=UPI000D733EBB|nr:uncharacterized protein LOC112569587 [Pomacea canaliculata]